MGGRAGGRAIYFVYRLVRAAKGKKHVPRYIPSLPGKQGLALQLKNTARCVGFACSEDAGTKRIDKPTHKQKRHMLSTRDKCGTAWGEPNIREIWHSMRRTDWVWEHRERHSHVLEQTSEVCRAYTPTSGYKSSPSVAENHHPGSVNYFLCTPAVVVQTTRTNKPPPNQNHHPKHVDTLPPHSPLVAL